MTGNVNKKITERIEKGNFSDEIKKFLGEILFFELEHLEDEKYRYDLEYQSLIAKYSKSFKEEEK